MGRKQKYIHLRMLTQGNHIMKFKIKKSKPILKILNNCLEKLSGYPPSLFRFIYDGIRITEKQTPRSLGMKKDDIIEFYEVQDGGGDVTLS